MPNKITEVGYLFLAPRAPVSDSIDADDDLCKVWDGVTVASVCLCLASLHVGQQLTAKAGLVVWLEIASVRTKHTMVTPR